MKIKLSVVLAIVVLASCSAPKYSYYFDHHDYYAGKKKSQAKENTPLAVDPEALTASISAQPLVVMDNSTTSDLKKSYLAMNKSERKTFRHQLKHGIKNYVKAKKEHAVEARGGMDNDLKLAIIFGAIGVVSLLIAGDVFTVIGAIALIIGVVFFVKWIIRQ